MIAERNPLPFGRLYRASGINRSDKEVNIMRKKKIIWYRRALVAGLALLILLLLFFGIRALWNALSPSPAEDPSAFRYDGQPVSADTYRNNALDLPAVDWNLMLVNAEYPLAEGYVPVLSTIFSRWKVDSRIAASAEAMLNDCKAAGLHPMICSAFRSVQHQQELFANRVSRSQAAGLENEDAIRDAADIVAVPGTSEHHTGLALDIVSADYQLLDEGQEATPENQWLRAHCAEYGFILRYPPDKTGETGIIYEPWHFRYVGESAASEIMEKGITLEEYSGVTVTSKT